MDRDTDCNGTEMMSCTMPNELRMAKPCRGVRKAATIYRRFYEGGRQEKSTKYIMLNA
jgi:hypothetical protein